MKQFLRISSLSLLLASTVLFSTVSCKKSGEDPAPVVNTTGTVDGTITPVTSVNLVILTTPGSTNGIATSPDVQGYFKFTNVDAGTYNLSFTTKSGYDAPTPRTITVTADKNTALGSITVTPTTTTPTTQTLSGTLTWQTDGVNRTGAVASGSISNANGVFSGLAITGVFQSGADVEKIELIVPTYRTPSIYNLDYATNGNYATFLRTTGGVPSGGIYTTKVSGLQGTVTVTAHNTTARTITGTFGYTSFYTNAGYNYRTTISNGTFSLSY